jgi:hypothetical protein
MQKIKSFYQSARGKFIITITGISSIFVLTSAVTSADLFEIGKKHRHIYFGIQRIKYLLC